MNRPSAPILAAIVLASASVRANSLTDEIGVGTTKTTRQNPRAGSLSNNLDASFDLSEQWTFNAGLGLTLEGATAKAPGSDFGGSSSEVANFSAGLQFDPTDSVSLGIDADVSPGSTQTAASQMQVVDSTGKETTANTQIRSSASNSSLGVTFGYDSAGESNLEWGFNLGLTGSHYSTTQRIVRIQTKSGDLTAAQVIAYCNAYPTNCSQAERMALRAEPADLDSAKLSVGANLTVYRDTDLSLEADYYGYSQDPTQAGYFSVGQAGRTTISSGNGIAIAPLRYLVRPEIGHRWGDFSARLWVTSGQYVDQTGQATRSVGTKLQYKFTKAFRLWVSASLQRDTDATGVATNSGAYALGAGYRF